MAASGDSETLRPGLSSRRWNATALAVFLAALAISFSEVWRAGPRSVVPSVQFANIGLASSARSDVVFETWLVARHAHTLVRRPWRLFDTEHCAPGEKTLTLGLPMITLGLLAVPASLLGDPILTYNLSLATLFLVSAAAMYLLVSDWTAMPAAGIAAGLFYAFHRVKLDQIYHPTEVDTAWIVFALFFARRLFSDGRWRDAVGLALAGALQIGSSFYMPLAGVFLAIPFAAWLLASFGLRRVRAAQLLCVAFVSVVAVASVYGPYLAARGEAPEHLRAAYQGFAAWRSYLPDQQWFLGWTLLALATVGCVVPRRLGLGALTSDPRAWLVAGALLLAIFAAGPLYDSLLAGFGGAAAMLNPYEMLAARIPGLDSVRGVYRLTAGVHLVVVVLAGAGMATAVRLAGRHARLVGAGFVGLALLAVFSPLGARGERASSLAIEEIRPQPGDIALFEALAAMGNSGAIVELPPVDGWKYPPETARRILIGAWHHRRTTACFGSFQLPGWERLAELERQVPRADALRELAAQGFTTLVVHDPRGDGSRLSLRLALAALGPERRLRLLHATDTAQAFAIDLAAESAAPAAR